MHTSPSQDTISLSTSMSTMGTMSRKQANRRRSLKTLFLPLSTKSSSYHPVTTTQVVGSMPADIILEIVELLAPADVLSFSLASSYTRTLLLPTLYTTLILKSSKKCKTTLEMLLHRPEISKHIKKLAVRPNYYLSWPKPDMFLDEEWVVGMVARIAEKGGLGGLQTFDWDGLEVPGEELWRTLRVNCPKLKSVFTNIGTKPLHPSSELFSFTDLTSFSLVVRHGLGGSELFPPLEPLPPRLWQMLSTHSPNLEELSICSFSSSTRILDITPLTQLHFPKLHTLTLGSFGYLSDFSLGPAADAGMGRFLERHRGLEYVRFLWNFKRWMSPDSIPMELAPTTLPNLTTFIGVYQQLIDFPNPHTIESVDLTCEPIYESRVEVLCSTLKRLTGLRSLDIWTHVPEGGGGGGGGEVKRLFEGIVGACPGLREWHFMCTTAFTSKPMSHLLASLPLLPHLTHFSLTKGHKYTDESMLSTALRIHKSSSSLKQINIRWARERCPNHLKQEGSYDILPDGKVMVVERGIPLVGRSFERRFSVRVGEGDKDKEKEKEKDNAKGEDGAKEGKEGKEEGGGGIKSVSGVVRGLGKRGSRLLRGQASFGTL